MKKNVFLTAFALFAVLFSEAQDLTHDVEADTLKWPAPVIDSAWKLNYMGHNNANNNVYVYKDKLYDGLFTRSLDGMAVTVLKQPYCQMVTSFGLSTIVSMD